MAKILLVDDDKSILALVKRILVKNGHLVTAEEDPLNAAKLVESTVYDLIITDLKMPLVSGLELIEKIKTTEINAKTNIAVLSTSSESEDVKKALELGVQGYIVKPAKSLEFMEKIEGLLMKINSSKTGAHIYTDVEYDAFAMVHGKVARISDSNIDLVTSYRLDKNQEVRLESKIFDDIGFTPPSFRVLECKAAGGGQWRTVLEYVGLSLPSMRQIKDWCTNREVKRNPIASE